MANKKSKNVFDLLTRLSVKMSPLLHSDWLSGKAFQFSLNVFIKFTELSDKDICHYGKRVHTCHLLC